MGFEGKEGKHQTDSQIITSEGTFHCVAIEGCVVVQMYKSYDDGHEVYESAHLDDGKSVLVIKNAMRHFILWLKNLCPTSLVW